MLSSNRNSAPNTMSSSNNWEIHPACKLPEKSPPITPKMLSYTAPGSLFLPANSSFNTHPINSHVCSMSSFCAGPGCSKSCCLQAAIPCFQAPPKVDNSLNSYAKILLEIATQKTTKMTQAYPFLCPPRICTS